MILNQELYNMNYLSVAEEMKCEHISDILINIEPYYTISLQEMPNKTQLTNFIADLFKAIEKMDLPLNFEDRIVEERYKASINDIIHQIASNSEKKVSKNSIASLNVDLTPLTFKESLWRHLTSKFEFLRADNRGNFDRLQEFITSLMENLCTHYQETYLKDDESEESSMEFPKYLNNTLQAFTAFSCSSLQTEQGYFQKRYYNLKEQLALQEKELASLLRLEGEPTFEQLCKGLEFQYSVIGNAISNMVKEIDIIKGFDDKGKIKEGLNFIQQSLCVLNEDFNRVDKPLRYLHKRRKIDGYFLPFHRIKTRQGFGTNKHDSKRSMSMQTSKHLYSEQMSYDSSSRLNTSSYGMKESSMKISGGKKILIRNMSDKSYDKRGIIDDPKNNACSVQETNPDDVIELEKLRNIMSQFGILKEEVIEDSVELKNKIDHFLGLEDKFNLLNLKYLKLADELNELKSGSLEQQPTQSSPQKEIVENLQRQLNDSENEKRIFYNDLIDEKKTNDHLSHQCDQYQDKIKKLNESVERKEFIIQNQAKRYQDLLSEIELTVKPKINQYRNDYAKLVAMLTDGHVRKNMKNYKELYERKIKINYDQIEFLQQQYEDFATAIELKSRKTADEQGDKITNDRKLKKLKCLKKKLGYEHLLKLFDNLSQHLNQTHSKMGFKLNDLVNKLNEVRNENKSLCNDNANWKAKLNHETTESQRTKKELEEQYRNYVDKLNDQLNEKTEEIAEKENTIQQITCDQQLAAEKYSNDIEALRTQINLKIKDLNNASTTIDNLQQSLSIKTQTIDKDIGGSEEKNYTEIDDEMEKMNIMNTKLIGELDIMLKKCNDLKHENTNLTSRIYELEDMEEKAKQLQLEKEMLENKIELFESNKQIDEIPLEQKNNENLEKQQRGFHTNTEKDYDSEKPSNETIQEVEENFERSDDYYSVDNTKLKHLTAFPVTEKETGFYSNYKRETNQISNIFTAIDFNYNYTYKKDDALPGFASPPRNSAKKNIFSKESIMKNIEAFRNSNQSIKNENIEKKDLEDIYLTPKKKGKGNRSDKVINIVNSFVDRIAGIVPTQQLNKLEDKLKKLEFILLENDIHSLAKPKHDSNLQAFTEQSNISKDQSALLEHSRSESKHSSNIISSMLQKKKVGNEKVDKPKEENRKLFSKQAEKKHNAKLDKLTKTYGKTSQTKKSQPKFNKEVLFKQPKLFTKSIKSNKKEQKSIEIDFEHTDKAHDLALKRLEDEMRAEYDALKIENVNLVNEMQNITEKNKEYKELLNKTFESAYALIKDQIAGDTFGKVEYLDHIMGIISTKIENYENTINDLEEEIEMIKQEMYNYQQFTPQENDDNFQQENSEAEDVNNDEMVEKMETNFSSEKQKHVKQAFEELLTNMFAITNANIEFIANVEEQVIPEHDDRLGETQKAETVHLVLEFDKLKTNTTNLKEMIECLYENLMEFMDENHESKSTEIEARSGSPMANLKAENEYLYQELSSMNEKYDELLNAYQSLQNYNRETMKKNQSSSQGEIKDQTEDQPPMKDQIKQFLNQNLEYVENPNEIKEEEYGKTFQNEANQQLDFQLEQLHFIVSRISQIVRSNTADNYKLIKIEELLNNPEAT